MNKNYSIAKKRKLKFIGDIFFHSLARGCAWKDVRREKHRHRHSMCGVVEEASKKMEMEMEMRSASSSCHTERNISKVCAYSFRSCSCDESYTK